MNNTRVIQPDDAEAALAAAIQNRSPHTAPAQSQKPLAAEDARTVKIGAFAVSTGRPHPGPPPSSLTDRFQPDPPPAS